MGLACFFEYDYEDGRNPEEYILELGAAVQRWWVEQADGRPAAQLALFESDFDASCA